MTASSAEGASVKAGDSFGEKAKSLDYDTLKELLGEGPMRFSHHGERSIKEQVDSLDEKERACFDGLKARWEKKERGFTFNDEMYLRFARCSPGLTKFNEEAAWKVMKKFDPRYLALKAVSIEKQLLSKTLFVVPGLKSKEGHDVFYMRPGRYFPKETPTKDVIDNLVYCMQTMVEKEKSCTEGIAFMANMADWGMSNFSVSYCAQFMKMLQGRVPVRVRLFLIVNPPHWFDVIWSIMKPMLAEHFRKKVHMIHDKELESHFMDGYAQFLPDDMEGGNLSTEAIVTDFLTYRKHIEGDGAGSK